MCLELCRTGRLELPSLAGLGLAGLGFVVGPYTLPESVQIELAGLAAFRKPLRCTVERPAEHTDSERTGSALDKSAQLASLASLERMASALCYMSRYMDSVYSVYYPARESLDKTELILCIPLHPLVVAYFRLSLILLQQLKRHVGVLHFLSTRKTH